jgi:ZIP family zinc transporter
VGYTARHGPHLLFALIASSPLVLGAYLGSRFTFPERLLAAVLAFAAGALITALTFELFEESFEKGGAVRAAGGLAWAPWSSPGPASCWTATSPRTTTLTAAPSWTRTPPPPSARPRRRPGPAAPGWPCWRPSPSTGVPENVALGISLEESGGSLALLTAIFASNLPESLVGAASMRSQGRSTAYAIGLWSIAAVLLTGAVLLGAGPLSTVSDETISIPLAFAAGAVIASLADTLMPEAYEQGGPLVALSTAFGFVVSFLLATM